VTRFGKDDAEITQGTIVSNKLLAGARQFIKDEEADKDDRSSVLSIVKRRVRTAVYPMWHSPSAPSKLLTAENPANRVAIRFWVAATNTPVTGAREQPFDVSHGYVKSSFPVWVTVTGADPAVITVTRPSPVFVTVTAPAAVLFMVITPVPVLVAVKIWPLLTMLIEPLPICVAATWAPLLTTLMKPVPVMVGDTSDAVVPVTVTCDPSSCEDEPWGSPLGSVDAASEELLVGDLSAAAWLAAAWLVELPVGDLSADVWPADARACHGGVEHRESCC
jgi:hypothetical protein